MAKPAHIVVFITTSGAAEAQQIAGALLEKKKAACVSIIPEVNSQFWWEGKLESKSESLLVVKTVAAALPEVIATVKETHSYTVPEIIALPIVGGNQDYLDWMEKEVRVERC